MISIIIPVKNGARTIRECLSAAKEQHDLDSPYEIIVVDDGSSDDTCAIAESLGLQVISQENAGPAAARNAGARAAQGDILAFTDADCVPDSHWLQNLTAPFQQPGVIGTKGTYRTHQASLIARFVQQEYQSKYARMAKQPTIDFIDTYSAAYRRDVFLQNGGFDPAFPIPSVEDQEFSFRLARKGYIMKFAPMAVVYHKHDKNVLEYVRRKYGIGYWKAFMLRWIPEKALSDSHTLASQRWQIVLLGLAGLLTLAAFIWPRARWLLLLDLALFYLTSLPLMGQILRDDPPVIGVAPFLLLLRAGSQALGLVHGFLFPPASRQRRTTGLNLLNRIIKRTFDILGSTIGLILSMPILAGAALAIKLEDGGPVFFVQERSGENGKPFNVVKLRTMAVGAEAMAEQMLQQNPLNGPVFKIPNDPRVTRVGHFLRRWSLDEIPQFWNVLRGEMSLVGPRPEETWIVARYNDEQRQRLAVKPGMTGPMQVNGRGKLDMEERLMMELEYINHYSVWQDIRFLLRTLPAVIRGEGAF